MRRQNVMRTVVVVEVELVLLLVVEVLVVERLVLVVERLLEVVEMLVEVVEVLVVERLVEVVESEVEVVLDEVEVAITSPHHTCSASILLSASQEIRLPLFLLVTPQSSSCSPRRQHLSRHHRG